MSEEASRLRPYLPYWLRARVGSPELRPGAVFTCSAAVLYADLRGFTRLTVQFADSPDGAKRLHEALNERYGALIETVSAYGGDVAAIAGDALTVWWPHHTTTTVARQCAEAMLAAVAELDPLDTPSGPFWFHLRIGIGSGMIHVAVVGLPEYGVHLVLTGPALVAATMAKQQAKESAVVCAHDHHPGALRTRFMPGIPGPPLKEEDFLPPTLSARIHHQELIAEYRCCTPVFAEFEAPAHPRDLHPLIVRVQAVVQHWGGWLNEIEIGDKGSVLVLLFGAFTANGADARRAVGCCLELREQGLITRAGLTRGTLYLGDVGGPQRRVYTAQGDEMNLAAHLMEHAGRGEILVSGRVRAIVQDRYPTGEPRSLLLKGHSRDIPVAHVLPAPASPPPSPALPPEA